MSIEFIQNKESLLIDTNKMAREIQAVIEEGRQRADRMFKTHGRWVRENTKSHKLEM